MANIQEDLQKILSSRYGKDVRQSIHDAISDINDEGIGSRNIANNAKEIANNAVEVSNTATSTANNAKEVAITSRNSAQASANTAAQQATAASESANEANTSATLATNKANEANTSATLAANKANEAVSLAAIAAQKATEATNSADKAEEWYDKTKNVSDSISGGFRPHGVIEFADLPVVTEVQAGDSYNISDAFITTSDFKGGAGKSISAGANVYMTVDSKWDILPIKNNVRVENDTLFITPGAV